MNLTILSPVSGSTVLQISPLVRTFSRVKRSNSCSAWRPIDIATIIREPHRKAIPYGANWLGHVKDSPLDLFGRQDPHANWAGWLYATDADSGQWKWRLKTNYPIVGGVTPTAGGLVFFGDVGGNFYAVDARSGKRVWAQKLDGAIGGGVITYVAQGSQKVAVAAGMTSIVWPTEQATAKIVILGLGKN